MMVFLSLLFLVVTIVMIVAKIKNKNKEEEKKVPILFVAVPLALTLICSGFTMIYTQSVGEVVVLKNWGGSLAGHDDDAGFGIKMPWQGIVKYDIRNNVLSFMGDSEEDQFEGGSANGSAVTINDAAGAQAVIDIQVNYSLDPSAAEDLYVNYGSQENFVKSICAVDIRAVPREVSGQFDTISILTARGDFTNAVQESLSKKWEKYGLIVEQVSIQNVVYPQSIVDKYAESQAAEISRATAENNQKVAEVDAQTKVIQAQGEADANAILSASLTNEVIQQRYIDALKEIGANGNLVVVPEGSDPIVSANK